MGNKKMIVALFIMFVLGVWLMTTTPEPYVEADYDRGAMP